MSFHSILRMVIGDAPAPDGEFTVVVNTWMRWVCPATNSPSKSILSNNKSIPMAKGFLDGYKKYDPSDGFGNPKQWKGAFHQRMSKEDAQVILDESQETPEAVLGVRIGATLAEIKQAYRRLMKVWHPDFNAHRLEEALRMSKKIIAANELLTD